MNKNNNSVELLKEFAKDFSEAYLVELELEIKAYLDEATIKKLEQETKKFVLYIRKRG